MEYNRNASTELKILHQTFLLIPSFIILVLEHKFVKRLKIQLVKTPQLDVDTLKSCISLKLICYNVQLICHNSLIGI